MEEKYRVCDDTLQKLLSWVDEVEKIISQQDVVKEDSEQLRNQINTVKVYKNLFFFFLNFFFSVFFSFQK